MTRVLAVLVAAAVVVTSLAVVETAMGGAKLSKRTALRKTVKLARKVARKQRNQGAVAYFAFGCTRKSRRVVNCVGGVGYSDNSACVQRVRNTRKGRRVVSKRFGRIGCGSVPQDAGGGGGGDDGTAICAIRQSVCI
jgi:hypothetical protein